MRFSLKAMSFLTAVGAIAALATADPASAAPPLGAQPTPAGETAPLVLLPTVKPTVKVTEDDLPINVAKAAAYCAGYEHAGTSKEFIDFPGHKFGQVMVFKNFETGGLCITQHATKRISHYLHRSEITIFDAACSEPIKHVSRNVRTKMVTVKYRPALAQDVCIEAGNSVVLDAAKPRNTTFASGTLAVNFI